MVMRNIFVLVAFALVGLSTPVWAGQQGKSPVKVFIMAGQSNMEGKGTIKHLEQVVSENAEDYGNLKSNGKWVERDDVWIDYLGYRDRRKKGKLTVGYGSPEDRIGPELGFGNLLGDAIKDPVLIIKYAIGGLAIAMEFRPPSSGPIDPSTIPKELQKEIESGKRVPGHNYRKMMAHIKNVMDNLPESMPGYNGGPVEIAGFVFFQGWNDQYNGYEKHYQTNMANFIRDVRKELKAPNLPFVIGGMGQGGDRPVYKSAIIRKAQAATAEMEEFKNNNVRYVPTAPYWRDGKQGDGEYHYNGNAEIFLLIGKAFGKAILEMQPRTDQSARKTTPSSDKDYEIVDVKGWSFHIHKEYLYGDQDVLDNTLKNAEIQLGHVEILVPEKAVKKLRNVPIWVTPGRRTAEYHWKRKWLIDNGRNPDMAHSIQITDINALRRTSPTGPWVLLHELMHGYHDREISEEDNKAIIDAYKSALEKGFYLNVLHSKRRRDTRVKAYAATRMEEYFAETCEAYFGVNDFYPFVKAELREYDPAIYEIIERVYHVNEKAVQSQL